MSIDQPSLFLLLAGGLTGVAGTLLAARLKRRGNDSPRQRHMDEACRLKDYALDQVREAVFLVGEDANILYANQAACRWLGYTEEELLRMLLPQILPGWSPEYDEVLGAKTGSAGDAWFEISLRRNDGSAMAAELAVRQFQYGEQSCRLLLVRDIAERKRLEQALTDERRMFAGGPSVAFKWRAAPGWPVEYVSPNVAEHFGYAPDALLKGEIRYVDLVDPRDQERVAHEVAEYVAAGLSSYEQEYRIIRSDGEVRWIYDFTIVIRDGGGNPTHFQGYIVDVTSRRISEEALRESEEKYRTLLEKIQAAVVVHDAATRVVSANPVALEILGLSGEQIRGRSAVDPNWYFLREDGSTATLDEYPANIVRQTGKAVRDYVLGVHRPEQNHVTWALVQADPVFEADGKLLQIVVTFMDITQRKNMEEALAEREREFRTLAENVPDHIIRYDARGRKTYLNSATARLMGIKPSEVTGLTPEETPTEVRAMALADFSKKLELTLKTGEPQEMEATLMHAELGRQTHNVRFVAERDKDGKIVGALMVGRDISERKKTEEELARYRQHLEDLVAVRTQELAQARDAAESANRAKSLFLANMSHELRTPLNAILGFAELMEHDETVPEQQRRSLATINRNGRHLLTLINDILEISKIESGRSTLLMGDCELHDLLDNVVDSMALRAGQQQLPVALHIDEGVPQYIRTDVGKLRQILINLLSNAVKYTERGLVEIKVSAESKRDDQSRLLILQVHDTGIGIPSDELERIFNPFYQTEQGYRLGEGTGLGLAISRQYSELLGGELTATSTLGKGSVFTLRLPVLLGQSVPPSPKPRHVIGLEKGEARRRVLVVEDREDSQRLLAQWMLQAGFDVRSVSNGKDAVAEFQAWQPEFIWMDMRMPVMDGYSATREIRSLPGGKDVRIVALTASVFWEDRGKIIDAGCDAVLAKPASAADLFHTMEELLGVRFRYEDEAEEAAREILPDLSLLPGKMRDALCRAASHLDVEATAQLISDIHQSQPQISDQLSSLVRSYRYDQIVAMCKAMEEHHG